METIAVILNSMDAAEMTHTAHEYRYLRDYAERRRARNRLLAACVVIGLAAIAGYLWRMP